ncbi:MAG: DUF1207 domain-containing protein [Planctomycetota bacterium]
MFRWIGCCFLVLGMSALAREDTARARADRKAPDDPTFGLQVQMGTDGNMRTDRAPRSKASFASFSDEQEEGKRGRAQKVDWQEPVQEEVIGSQTFQTEDEYEWQVMPAGLMYKAYLAGEKESRMSSVFFGSKGRDGTVWENTLGGHVGLLRYGTTDAINPQGWQFDLEGAAMPRVDMGHNDDLEACDFRAGFLSTWRKGDNAFKAGYYHLSSHAGDEYMIRNPTFVRLNYVRDSLIVGWTRNLTRDTQAYGEVAYAFNHEDGAEPLELQYGLQYTPMVFGLRGAPFAAINGHTRQDFGYVTSVNITAGWQWRGYSNHLWRFGFQYYKGPALQWEFAGQKDTLTGAGMWMDY